MAFTLKGERCHKAVFSSLLLRLRIKNILKAFFPPLAQSMLSWFHSGCKHYSKWNHNKSARNNECTASNITTPSLSVLSTPHGEVIAVFFLVYFSIRLPYFVHSPQRCSAKSFIICETQKKIVHNFPTSRDKKFSSRFFSCAIIFRASREFIRAAILLFSGKASSHKHPESWSDFTSESIFFATAKATRNRARRVMSLMFNLASECCFSSISFAPFLSLQPSSSSSVLSTSLLFFFASGNCVYMMGSH